MTMTKSVQLIDPGDEQRFSDGYMVAMEQIEFELRTRDPEYRDRNHYNWPSEYAQPRRLFRITNVIVCSLCRAPMVLAHHILGTPNRDNLAGHCDFDATEDILFLLFGMTPSNYISSRFRLNMDQESINTLLGLAELGDLLQQSRKNR